MPSGSWLDREWGLGSQPAAMNADDKAYLGFVRPKVVKRGCTARIRLQAASEGTAGDTTVKIALPKARHIAPLSGDDGAMEWYPTMGDNVDVVLATKRSYRSDTAQR